MTVRLHAEGVTINWKRVQRYRRELGIAGSTPGPNLRKRAAQHHISPYLLRGVTATAPNAIWGSASTSIRLRSGWRSLGALLDWYARYVISWSLDATQARPFGLAAVDQAQTVATPTTWNSDQGSHAPSPQLTRKREAAGARIRMDGGGRAHDTSVTERLWRSIKSEEVDRHADGSPRAARMGIAQYMLLVSSRTTPPGPGRPSSGGGLLG